jgi:hypothetical protein
MAGLREVRGEEGMKPEIIKQQLTNGTSPTGVRMPPGRITSMVNGIRSRKGQTGIYLSVVAKNLLVTIAGLTGLTQSMVVELALKEYAHNHHDELRHYQEIKDDKGYSFR